MKYLLCVLTLLLLVGTVCAQSQQPRIITGTVVRVYDGDTVTVKLANGSKRNVRLAGIDAPEIRGHQPFYQAARDYLAFAALGKTVTVTLIGRDTKWKRDLGIVRLGDEDLGLRQLQAGYAWFFRQYGKSLSEADRARYDQAERDAQASKLGLFGARHKQVPPWRWRRGVR